MAMEQLIKDNEKNFTLFRYHHNKYREYEKNRQLRKNKALNDQLLPLNYRNLIFTLDELNELKNNLIQAKTMLPRSIDELDNRINSVQQKIDNNEYLTEDNPDYALKMAYEQAKKDFVWPTQEEIDIRDQEEQELILFLEQNT
jgi:hypothetical protein